MFSKKQYKAQNSRRFKRMRADYLVKYQVPGTNESFLSNIKDLSAGGVKFWTDQPLIEGSLLKTSFLVPPLELTVEALARVVRVRQSHENTIYYVAVRFIEIPDESKKAIDEFIEYLAAKPDARGVVEFAEGTVKRAQL
jgi:c-di-GMP-binding flagellar brake protein YcgR